MDKEDKILPVEWDGATALRCVIKGEIYRQTIGKERKVSRALMQLGDRHGVKKGYTHVRFDGQIFKLNPSAT